MANPELRENLEKLQQEIQHTQTVDDQGRELLQSLDQEIHQLLQRSEGQDSSAEGSLVAQLEKNIRHFEVTHPALTAAMNQLMAILSNAGI
jgi:hypothetical protein